MILLIKGAQSVVSAQSDNPSPSSSIPLLQISVQTLMFTVAIDVSFAHGAVPILTYLNVDVVAPTAGT